MHLTMRQRFYFQKINYTVERLIILTQSNQCCRVCVQGSCEISLLKGKIMGENQCIHLSQRFYSGSLGAFETLCNRQQFRMCFLFGIKNAHEIKEVIECDNGKYEKYKSLQARSCIVPNIDGQLLSRDSLGTRFIPAQLKTISSSA